MPEFEIKIEVQKLTIGVKGNPPFLQEQLHSKVLTDESYWMIEDDELHILLTKMKKAEMWECALLGHSQQALDPIMQEEVKK